MNAARLVVLVSAVTMTALCSCDAGDRVRQTTSAAPAVGTGREVMSPRISVKVGQKAFTATLEDNPATVALRTMLPVTLEMSDLNANEKYHHLDARLPTAPIRPGTIRAGDLLLYGDDSLVLFYETFRSSYSYTRLGRLDDPAGLTEAVGAGSVTVTFEEAPSRKE